jgi:hypothetical protein
MIHLPQICLNFLVLFHRLGGKEILWEKRNFGDCKRIFEQAVVEALIAYSCKTRNIFTVLTRNVYFVNLVAAVKPKA